MRIVIDLQGRQSSGSKYRGIGRYSLSITKAIIRNKKEHEVLIMLSSLFPKEIEEIQKELKNILPKKNIVVWEVNNDISYLSKKTEERYALEHSRELFLEMLQPDIVYITSLFEGLSDGVITSVATIHNNYLVASTLYDLIPLIHKTPYLDNPNVCQWYEEKIEHIKRADLLLAISESSRKESLKYLDASANKVINISTAADAQFKQTSISKEEVKEVYGHYNIYNPFLMYTGGIDHRKNIERLIEAYANIDKQIRASHQLAIVCSIEDAEKERLTTLVREFGLADTEVIFTGFIPEEHLILLYNVCKGFIFPSWHEGFGLPVLEAMHCGVPVIASNTSSLPEVVGLEDALFDPYSISDMGQKITALLTDNEYRKKLLAHNKRQKENFSWDISGKKAIEAFEHATKGVISNSARTMPKQRLAYISPLPPERSGISDYSAELLPELYEYYDIDVVIAQDNISDTWINKHCHTINVDTFKQTYTQYGRVLYHFGNSHFHQHMFNLLLDLPGVVVLHDFFLSGLSNYMQHSKYTNHSFKDDLFYAHGNAPFNDTTPDLTLAYPVNKKILDYARGIIVHSQNSVKLAKEWYGKIYGNNWSIIPLLRVSHSNKDSALTFSRELLNLPKDAFIVATFGIIAETKQNLVLLQAWIESKLAKDDKSYLIFVGENTSGDYGKDIFETIGSCPFKDRIIITGWTETETFKHYLSSANIGVQLRTHSRGETSAAVLDCMNYGLATIVNANGSMADLPKDAVYMLKDNFEQSELIDALEILYSDKEKRETLGKNAQEIISTRHDPKKCALLYAQSIENYYTKTIVRKEGLVELLPKVKNLQKQAVIFEAKSLEFEDKYNTVQQRLNLIENSTSWKLTKPYRTLGIKIKWFKGNAKAWVTFSPTSRPRKVLKHKLLATKSYINKHPKLKRKLVDMIDIFPTLKNRLQKVGKSPIENITSVPITFETLSPEAQGIYQKLNNKQEKNQGNTNA